MVAIDAMCADIINPVNMRLQPSPPKAKLTVARICALAILAGFLLLHPAFPCHAAEVKISGNFDYVFGYLENTSFSKSVHHNSGKSQDPVMLRQRFRPQFQFIATENLSALLLFEIGYTY